MAERLKEYLAVARGERVAELVLKEVRVVNVYTGEIFNTDLAIHHGRIIGWGTYSGQKELNLKGRYLVPGLIDAHLHLESAMVLPDEFCRQVVPRGITTIAVDPHELANVAGIKGIEFIRQYFGHLPINLLVQLPSCVPATFADQAGAVLNAEDLKLLLDLPGIHGLGEMMNFYGVIQGDPEVLAKIEMIEGRFVDGHAPLLKGNDLNAYVLAGIKADHECTDIEEAREKIRRGMYIMVREGSAAKDLLNLLPLINEDNGRRFVFCTDDRHPFDLTREGHLDFLIRKAIKSGMDPIQAIRMATLNAAECLGLSDLGAIAPGKRADLVVVDDLEDFKVYQVYKDGQLVAEEGELIQDISYQPEIDLRNTVKTKELSFESFRLSSGRQYRVIQVLPGQLLTKEVIQFVQIEGKKILEPDVAKIVVVERHHRTGQVGVGLVKGFGLKEGAIGSSVAHDSHNLIAVGRNDESIMAVLNGIIENQGGLAIAKEGQLIEILPLPIGGLISDKKLTWVEEKLDKMHHLAHLQGVSLTDPFMTLSFLALPVIPELKMTSRGLFDVRQNKLVPLVVE
ncbi:adenine deaminase [Anoxybacter fermentans]|uniref:Adenine deaminase n=1 Tax=Anoxybacter fermentans TaxID=1323375 RepID=A0A3S9SZ28_9FIRM|nr:adenine deaminase [Anoxybacter fermentans]AZR73596.1 adenine deaminase [Anoxybacter fermentans]